MTDEALVDRDIEALLEHLKEPGFATTLTKALRDHDSKAATNLAQTTAESVVTVSFDPEPRSSAATTKKPGPNRGRFCWFKNGVRKCLWYDKC